MTQGGEVVVVLLNTANVVETGELSSFSLVLLLSLTTTSPVSVSMVTLGKVIVSRAETDHPTR